MNKRIAAFLMWAILSGGVSIASAASPSDSSEAANPIRTGADRPVPTALFPTSKTSAVRVSGAVAESESSAVASLKVFAERGAKGHGVVRAVALDNFSNVVPLSDSAWRLLNGRLDEKVIAKTSDPMRGLDAAILVERGLCSKGDNFSAREIAEFVPIMNNQDRALVAEFNQSPKFRIGLADAGAVKFASESLNFDSSYGLSAPNRAAVGAINFLKARENGNKPVIIIVSFCSDNGSLIFMPEDVEKRAGEIDAAVYVIAFDESAGDPCLMDVARRTGGAFYALETADSSQLSDILKEIYLCEKFAAEIEIPKDFTGTSLAVVDAKGSRVEQTLPARPDERLVGSPQIAALFDFESVAVPAEYDASLRSLADVLIDNPSKIIELSGFSGAELLGSDSRSFLSVQRAQAVRGKLISMGVSPTQIRVSEYGYQAPESPSFGEREWSAALARRVELRWLDPSLLPYELVESFYESEDAAASRVQFYEKEGLRAYYAPVVRGEKPAYCVRLWGFATPEEAAAAAKNLKSRFKKDFTVK